MMTDFSFCIVVLFFLSKPPLRRKKLVYIINMGSLISPRETTETQLSLHDAYPEKTSKGVLLIRARDLFVYDSSIEARVYVQRKYFGHV